MVSVDVSLESSKRKDFLTQDVCRYMIENAGIMLAYLDSSICFKAANSTFTFNASCPMEKLLGSSYFDVFSNKDDRLLFNQAALDGQPIQQEDKEFTFTNQPSRGTTYWNWLLTPIKRVNDNIEFVLALRETTEKRKAEDALRGSEEKFRTLAENCTDVLARFDTQSNIVYLSRSFTTITALQINDFLGKPFYRMLQKDDAVKAKEIFKEVIKDKKPKLFEFELNTPAGIRVLSWNLSPEIVGDKVVSVMSIVRDVTEHKKLEGQLANYTANLERLVKEQSEKLRIAERLAAVGETAGMIGHDIRNPLQSITSNLFLLKEEISGIPDGNNKRVAIECADEIQEQIFYIDKIVADLQDYYRVIKPNPTKQSLVTFLPRLLSTIIVPKNIEVRIKVDPVLRSVRIDYVLLTRALTNLILNALQAMPNGGKLTLKAVPNDGFVVVSVEDTGAGIPKEAYDKLFTPLFTTKAKGQGLGLAVVKRMVEALGGYVEFKSQLGRGTKFTIRLPHSVRPKVVCESNVS